MIIRLGILLDKDHNKSLKTVYGDDDSMWPDKYLVHLSKSRLPFGINGQPPENKDHRKSDNPYESRYGESWPQQLWKTLFLNCYSCITDLVEHMVQASNAHFTYTKYKDTWVFFYHDALSLLTAKETIEWMKKKKLGNRSYYDCWLLPKHGLNVGTTYDGRPVGNSPEMMPMDASLNKDVDDGVKQHIAYSYYLPDDDSHKFSMARPKMGLFAYRRVWNNPPVEGHNDGAVPNTNSCSSSGCPSSRQIVQDINKFLVALVDIIEAEGAIIIKKGSVRRHGHRAAEAREVTKKICGGYA